MKRAIAHSIIVIGFIWVAAAGAVPDGYSSSAINTGLTCSGILTVDPDGVVLFGHSTTKNKHMIPGINQSRGASGEIYAYDPNTAAQTLFYSQNDHPGLNQIKSAASIAIDPTVTPWKYYIGDQDPAGDPWTRGAIWIGSDLNDDGDINDPGETALATADNAFINIEGVIIDPVTGDLFVTNAAGLAGSVMVYRLNDADHNDFFDPGEIHDYYIDTAGVYVGKLCFDGADMSTVLTVDSGGTLTVLHDSNDDGDCLDPGDATSLTSTLEGGYGIAVDPEGDVFVTASNFISGAHLLYEIRRFPATTVTEFEDLSSFTGWTGPIAFSPGSSFEPNEAGSILYMSYSDLTWADPSELKIYQGTQLEVPATGGVGLAILIGLISIILYFKR